MTRRIAAPILAIALIMAACSSTGAGETTTTAVQQATSTTPSTTSTTVAATAATTAAPAPADTALSGRGDAAGLGDSRLPALGNGGYDVAHYDLELTVIEESPAITGVTTIEAIALDELTSFNLDFGVFEIVDLAVDGTAASHSRAGTELTVIPATTISSGDAFTVRLEYTGIPAPVQSQAIRFEVGWRTASDGTRFVVAEPDGASSWFPSNNHPLDKATYTISVTAPAPLLAVANGTLVETVTDVGANTYVYDMPQPMASYLATVVIGQLVSVDDPAATAAGGVPIRNVLPPDVAASPPEALALQGDMLAFLEGRFGPYPFDLYGIAVVPEFPAALENQTLSIFGRDLIDFPILEAVLVHELAHQWFGDHVSPADWGDIWLNEGFATYAEWLWLEHTDGPEALTTIAQGSRDAMALADLPPPGNPPATDLFNASVYRRGGLTLHALRSHIGDDAFFTTLRTYVERFAGSTASTADFIAVAEEVAGQELDELFDAWLFAETVPEL